MDGTVPGSLVGVDFIKSTTWEVSWSYCFFLAASLSFAGPPLEQFKVQKKRAPLVKSAPLRQCGRASATGGHPSPRAWSGGRRTTQTHHSPDDCSAATAKGPGELSTDPISTWAISLHPFNPHLHYKITLGPALNSIFSVSSRPNPRDSSCLSTSGTSQDRSNSAGLLQLLHEATLCAAHCRPPRRVSGTKLYVAAAPVLDALISVPQIAR
jgi:hypothetical protein